MNFMTVKEASKKWGISARRITTLCDKNRIGGAVKASGVWIMPADAKKPKDARIRTGNYIGWREKNELAETDFERNIKNVGATLQIEGMQLGESVTERLEKIENGSATYRQTVEELKMKYAAKRV